MKKQLYGSALAAKNLKAELRGVFPGVKFSVVSERFSMGDAVRVCYEGGPDRERVQTIANKYQEGDFDGMTDSYVYDRDQGREAFRKQNGSAMYVSVRRVEHGANGGR